MNQRPPGSVRIIAGHLRGSKLPVPDRPGLRPTGDRVRETLFNWLQDKVPGARVLDLFAGTGALGLEAASRGAASVVLVERDPGLAETLRGHVARFKLEGAQVVQGDALAWLSGPPTAHFDLVFLDPPFDGTLWEPAAQRLVPWLAPGAWIYVESPTRLQASWPPGWRLHREGQTREVRFTLFQSRNGQAPETADTLQPEPTPQVKPTA